MEWFERWFGEEYLLVYEHRNIQEAEREVQAIKDILNLHEHELVLDLCCGPGRHDIVLIRQGYRVIGLDYSMPLLKIASEAIPLGKAYPKYIRGDARMIPFRENTFDVILNLFTSFGYFQDDENRALLGSIANLLKPGGRFYIDYLNPIKVEAELVPESVRIKDGIRVEERRTINQETRRVEKQIHLRWDNNSQTFHESVQLYSLEEMLAMIADAGLTTDGFYGSVEREPYGESSPRMILFGIKG